MKHAQEIKVGLSLIVSLLIFIFGFRYFENLPLFKGTYSLYTSFDNAGGITSGNDVRINGVNVGAIDDVDLDVETNKVLIQFHVRDDIRIPAGSYTKLAGISALSSIYLEVILGSDSTGTFPEDGFIPSGQDIDILSQLTERAPQLIEKIDTVLESTSTTLEETAALVSDPESPLGKTLLTFEETAESLGQLLREEQGHLSGVLSNLEDITSSVKGFTSDNSDSLDLLVGNLNQVIQRLDNNLAALESTTSSLNAILDKIDRGDGTLGLLVNDPSVYSRLDSTLTRLNRILVHFEEDPARYLRELKLVDIL